MDDDNPLLTPLRRYSGYGTTVRTAIFNYFPTHESLESLHRIVLKQKKTSPDHRRVRSSARGDPGLMREIGVEWSPWLKLKGRLWTLKSLVFTTVVRRNASQKAQGLQQQESTSCSTAVGQEQDFETAGTDSPKSCS